MVVTGFDVACYSPLKGYRDASGGIIFAERGRIDGEVTFACGMCIGCRIARTRMWALRIVHESKLHDRNAFVTLTYSPEHLPAHGSLQYADVQKFLKRLRKSYGAFRFFAVGEYGEDLTRPHYHVCLFGYWPRDARRVHPLADEKYASWSSTSFEKTWGLGQVQIGELTYQSAQYCAGYIFKKKLGHAGKSAYKVVDLDGVVHDVSPEFARMSLKPGIGHDWYMRHRGDFHNWDKAVHDGKLFPVPKYYDRLLERVDPQRLSDLREARELVASRNRSEQHPVRLHAKAVVAAARIRTFDERMKK